MRADARTVIAAAALTCTLAGGIYAALALSAMIRFRGRISERTTAAHIPITVFKPLCGPEPGLYENLGSFCAQDYACYQVIFAAADAADPALDVARAVARDFPDCDIAIVAGHSATARNPKIANILAMQPLAKHPLFVVADSDIAVGRKYLAAVAGAFAGERIGAATCVYGAIPRAGLASVLGALFVNDAFAPSVLVAQALEGLRYCFGATMAVGRGVLASIGGFETIADALGDDYALGNAVHRAGYHIALIPYVVRTDATEADARELWTHEVRWARTIATQRRAGYTASVITNFLPFAVTYAALSWSPAGLLVLGGALALRALVHDQARRTFAPSTRAAMWLLPVRDFLTLGVWCAGLSGRAVTWHASRYTVNPDGRMVG